MDTVEKIGREEERLVMLDDLCVLDNLPELDLLRRNIRNALLGNAYREREYDQWATAYYHAGSEVAVREEPVVIHRWRNAIVNPQFKDVSLELEGEIVRSDRNGNVFLKFSKEDMKKINGRFIPGDIQGFSVITRGVGEARSLIEEVLRGFFADVWGLSEMEDKAQRSHDPNTKVHSFGVRVEEPIKDDLDDEMAA